MLLLLCMKLIDWLPDADCAQTPLYRAAKHFFLEAELAGVLSPAILQATLLIAFYELGHGLYPSASTSVGVCVRYGAALGIKPRSMAPANDLSAAWVEEEERTRLWWSLFLLDRFTSLIHPGELPGIEGPRPEHLLPSDDRLRDCGTSVPSSKATVAFPCKLQHARFCLVAQAAVLLDQALEMINLNNKVDESVVETTQLQRTIEALLEFTRMECSTRHLYKVSGCEAKAILYGALIALHATDKVSRPTSSDMAFLVGSELAALAWEQSLHQKDISLDQWPPFAVHVIYQGAISLMNRNTAGGFAAVGTCLQPFKSALAVAQRRWLSAAVYLKDLEAREMDLL